MPPNTQSPEKIIRVSRKKSIIALVVIGILVAFASVLFQSFNSSMMLGVGENISFSGSSAGGGIYDAPSMMYDERMPAPYYDTNPKSIADTREFLKINYSAQIKTRNVSRAMDEAENAVRDVNGRVDSLSSSEKYGYISFVIPKSELSEFKDLIEKITHRKLFTENTSSQNLLGQKQNIEENFLNTQNSLTALQKEKAELDKNHTSAVNAYQKELAALALQIATLDQQIAETTNTNERTALQQQRTLLVANQTRTSQALSEQKNAYAMQSKTLATRITNAQSNVDSVIDQDIAFGENIETVNGHINVQWISVWNILREFLPIRPGWIIVIILILGWIILRKTKVLPKVEFI